MIRIGVSRCRTSMLACFFSDSGYPCALLTMNLNWLGSLQCAKEKRLSHLRHATNALSVLPTSLANFSAGWSLQFCPHVPHVSRGRRLGRDFFPEGAGGLGGRPVVFFATYDSMMKPMSSECTVKGSGAGRSPVSRCWLAADGTPAADARGRLVLLPSARMASSETFLQAFSFHSETHRGDVQSLRYKTNVQFSDGTQHAMLSMGSIRRRMR